MSADTRTVVVIGGARSIGGRCARVFTREGWNCVLADTRQKHLNEVSDEIGSDKLTAHHGVLDTELGLRNVLAGALEAYGRIDAVIHVPDLPNQGTLLDGKSGDFEECVIAPARAVTSAIRLFARQMLDQDRLSTETARAVHGHSFVTIFGMAAVAGDPQMYSQTASQSMALAAARATTLELAEHGLRINAIVAVRPRAETDEPWLKQRTPLGRHSHAEEIAETSFFLSGPGAANMTGQTVMIDGGRTMLNGLMPSPSD